MLINTVILESPTTGKYGRPSKAKDVLVKRYRKLLIANGIAFNEVYGPIEMLSPKFAEKSHYKQQMATLFVPRREEGG
jgi:hypothetical protein